MPRIITAAEAAQLGAQPVEPRVLSAEEAQALGAVPVESNIESRIAELGGVKQADGTYLVPGENGGAALQLDAEGNQVDAPAIGEESTREAIGNRVLATAASGAQGLAPQIAGAARVAATGDTGQYAKTRDSTKAAIEQARAKAGIGYDIAGKVLSAPVAPAGAIGRMGVSAILSGVEAAADSDVDLTKPGASLERFAADVSLGAAIGGAGAGVGEALGAGLRKLGSKAADVATKAFRRQEAADAKAIEKGLKSLAGELGAETQKGSRFIENVQRGTGGIQDPAALQLAQGVLQRNEAAIPGQLAVIAGKETALAAATATATSDAKAATRAYFDKGLWTGEILPKLKQQAPRWGMALAGMGLGEGYDLVMGEGSTGKNVGAAFGLGSTLSSPGMRAMLGNIAKSNRVQKAIGDKLGSLLVGAANAITRGTVVTGRELADLTPHEGLLGPPELAAQQLIARGGLASVLGDNGRTDESLNAPQSELDRAIQQTTGVTLLAGALDDQNATMSKALDRVLKGKPEASKSVEVPGLAELAANPESMLQRLTDNTGSLANVAPGIAAELAATAKRATDYLLNISATPPKAGPLAPDWVRSDAEKRSIRIATNVVAQPMSILESAASGMLVPEQVSALNAVYPMLGRQMADMALDKLMSGDAVSYRARLMVGFLTGVDPDGTFASIALNQAAIRAQSQKPSNTGVAQQAGADKLSLAQRTSERQTTET